MDDGRVVIRKAAEDVGDDLGGGHLFVFFGHGHKVHECEAFLVVLAVQLFLGLQEAVDHDDVDLVVLADAIFAFLYTGQQVLLQPVVLAGRRERGHWSAHLHEGLVEMDIGHECKLLLDDQVGLAVLVQDNRHPLLVRRLGFCGLEQVVAVERECFKRIFEGQVELEEEEEDAGLHELDEAIAIVVYLPQ